MADNPFAKYGGKPIDDDPFAKYGGSTIDTSSDAKTTFLQSIDNYRQNAGKGERLPAQRTEFEKVGNFFGGLIGSPVHAFTAPPNADEVGIASAPGGQIILGLKRLLYDPQKAEAVKASQTQGVESIGHAGAAAIPLVGPAAGAAGEAYGAGDFTNGTLYGSAAIMGGRDLAQTRLPKAQDVDKASAQLTDAARPTSTKAERFLQSAKTQADILADIAKNENPKTVGQAGEAIKNRSLAMENRYQQLLQQNGQNPANTAPVAQNIRQFDTAAIQKQDPALSKAINDSADKYANNQFTVSELEQLRDKLNGELDAELEKTGLTKAKAKKDPRTAYRLAELEAVKDTLYNALGPEARSIKQTQSNLIRLQSALERQRQNLVVKEASRNAVPWYTKVGSALSGIDVAKPVKSVKNFVDPFVPQTLAPNARIRQAMGNYAGTQGKAPGVVGGLAAMLKKPSESNQ